MTCPYCDPDDDPTCFYTEEGNHVVPHWWHGSPHYYSKTLSHQAFLHPITYYCKCQQRSDRTLFYLAWDDSYRMGEIINLRSPQAQISYLHEKWKQREHEWARLLASDEKGFQPPLGYLKSDLAKSRLNGWTEITAEQAGDLDIYYRYR